MMRNRTHLEQEGNDAKQVVWITSDSKFLAVQILLSIGSSVFLTPNGIGKIAFSPVYSASIHFMVVTDDHFIKEMVALPLIDSAASSNLVPPG